MANSIRIKRRANGSGAGAPSTLENAELAYNEQDNILYYGTGTGGVGGSATQVLAIAGSGAYVPLAHVGAGGTAHANAVALGAAGFMTGTDKDKLDNIASNANNYVHPSTDGTLHVPATSNTNDGKVLTAGATAGSLSWVAPLALSSANPAALGTVAPGVATTASKSDHVHQLPLLNALGAPTGAVSLNNQRITGLATPTADTDAATRLYVDSAVQGLDPKQTVRAATTAAGTLASSFANASVIDGVTLVTGNRILIQNQAAPAENGIYTVNVSGAPTRALDMDNWLEVPGAYVFVEEGTINADTGFVCTSNTGGTLNTTAITFVAFSGAGQITANGGLTKVGNTISVALGASGVNLTTQVTGTLPVANGGTGATASTGSGNVVLATSPTLTTPNIGTATGTSFNSITGLSSTNPLIDGTAAFGSATTAARGDHVHPTDTGRAAVAQTMYIGTTAVAINRASAALVLTGISSIDGTAANVTGTVAIANGGTNSNATPTNGGIGYGTGTAHAYSAVGTAGQYLKSNAAAAPTWTTLSLIDLPDAWAKKSVRLASTANVVIATGGLQTVDTIVTVAGDRVLLKNQSAPAENGIYQVNAGAWTRTVDADSASEIAGALVNVDTGSVNGGKLFDCDFKSTDTLGTTAINFYTLTDSSYVVPATTGGTGQTSYAVGDLLFANTTTTVSKLADVVVGNVLISGGVGVSPSYGKVALTTHVSGTLPLANGGTNNTTGYAVGILGGLIGQIPYQTAVNATTFLAAGTTGQVLMATTGAAPSWSSNYLSTTSTIDGGTF